MHFWNYWRARLGFPVWLPLILGVALFWAGHYLLGGKHHQQHQPSPTPVHTVSWKLISA